MSEVKSRDPNAQPVVAPAQVWVTVKDQPGTPAENSVVGLRMMTVKKMPIGVWLCAVSTPTGVTLERVRESGILESMEIAEEAFLD